MLYEERWVLTIHDIIPRILNHRVKGKTPPLSERAVMSTMMMINKNYD